MREATIRLSDEELDALGIGEFVAAFRDAGLVDVRELQCRRPGCLLAVTVEEPVPDDELDTLDTAFRERIDGDDGVTYLCKVPVPALEDGVEPYPETDVSSGGMSVTDDSVEITLVGSHEALGERVREYDRVGADVLLRRISDYGGPERVADAMTDRQREVVTAAFEMGYFEVPREATTEDVAASLDVDASTVREHLQRAQRNLLGAVLDP